MSGICDKGKRQGGKRGKIICTVTDKLCAHQYWCSMACEYRHTAQVDNCPGKHKDKDKAN